MLYTGCAATTTATAKQVVGPRQKEILRTLCLQARHCVPATAPEASNRHGHSRTARSNLTFQSDKLNLANRTHRLHVVAAHHRPPRDQQQAGSTLPYRQHIKRRVVGVVAAGARDPHLSLGESAVLSTAKLTDTPLTHKTASQNRGCQAPRNKQASKHRWDGRPAMWGGQPPTATGKHACAHEGIRVRAPPTHSDVCAA